MNKIKVISSRRVLEPKKSKTQKKVKAHIYMKKTVSTKHNGEIFETQWAT